MKIIIDEIKKGIISYKRFYVGVFFVTFLYLVVIMNKMDNIKMSLLDIIFINFRGMTFIQKKANYVYFNGYWIANNFALVYLISNYINEELHKGWQKIIRLGKRNWWSIRYVVILTQIVCFYLVQVLACAINFLINGVITKESALQDISGHMPQYYIGALFAMILTAFSLMIIQISVSLLFNEKIAIAISFCLLVISAFVPEKSVFPGSLLMLERYESMREIMYISSLIEGIVSVFLFVITMIKVRKYDYY